jgi:hypothetical protein
MRMRSRSPSFPDVSALYLFAQMSASEEINSNSSETKKDAGGESIDPHAQAG